MKSSMWNHENLPRLIGKTYIVTGANSGLGLETSRVLADLGARVIMACRNPEKGIVVVKDIQQENPQANVLLKQLDLANLDSIRRFAQDVMDTEMQLHGLINNAGVMMIPRLETQDGFEMQLGTNHLGHFALTALLLDRLIKTPQARVVNVSSLYHRFGKIHFDDLMLKNNYNNREAYGQSKLANLLFTYQLKDYLQKRGVDLMAVAAHPGYTATNLQMVGPQISGSKLMMGLMKLANAVLAQHVSMGALPILYAAVGEDVHSGDFIGPDGFMETRGFPTKVHSNGQSHNMEDAKKLWGISEQLTGVKFPDE